MKNQKGQSIMEVIFAIALISLVAVAIVGLATVSIRNNASSKNSTLAKRYAQEAVDWLRKKRDVGPWSRFVSYATGVTYCLDELDEDFSDSWSFTAGSCGSEEYISGTKLIREMVLTAGTDKVQAVVTVSWDDAKGGHQSRLTTEFAKW